MPAVTWFVMSKPRKVISQVFRGVTSKAVWRRATPQPGRIPSSVLRSSSTRRGGSGLRPQDPITV